MQADQPRPDLDATLEAVLRSLTAVSDDAAAASLRRTRTALADGAASPAGLGVWRWSLTALAVAAIVVASAVALLRRDPPAPGAMADGLPAIVPIAAKPPVRRTAAGTSEPEAERVASAVAATQDAKRASSVGATPQPSVVVAPRPDPLLALVRAMQGIPEEAWNESLVRARSPISAPEVAINPIVVPELLTPPIADPFADANAPGDL